MLLISVVSVQAGDTLQEENRNEMPTNNSNDPEKKTLKKLLKTKVTFSDKPVVKKELKKYLVNENIMAQRVKQEVDRFMARYPEKKREHEKKIDMIFERELGGVKWDNDLILKWLEMSINSDEDLREYIEKNIKRFSTINPPFENTVRAWLATK